MAHVTSTRFVVHSFDSDAFGYLTPMALAGYLQEAAGQSADSHGFGMADLNRQGLTWVLVREQFELDRPIRFGDSVEVETWPSGIDRWAALRDFRLYVGDTQVGRALTSWFALDIATRHPVRPKTVLPEEYHPQSDHVLSLWADSLSQLEAVALERHFQVRFADIDANLHVTNASYVAWVVEAVENEVWSDQWLAGLDIQFLAECSLGARVRTRSSSIGQGVRLHAVVREEDSKDLARARSVWNSK